MWSAKLVEMERAAGTPPLEESDPVPSPELQAVSQNGPASQLSDVCKVTFNCMFFSY